MAKYEQPIQVNKSKLKSAMLKLAIAFLLYTTIAVNVYVVLLLLPLVFYLGLIYRTENKIKGLNRVKVMEEIIK